MWKYAYFAPKTSILLYFTVSFDTEMQNQERVYSVISGSDTALNCVCFLCLNLKQLHSQKAMGVWVTGQGYLAWLLIMEKVAC